MAEYLSYFIDLIKRLNFKIKVLCLDREFYSIDVFEFLQNNGVAHIVPVVKKGEQMKQILKGNKARSAQYVMKNSKKKIHLDIIIDVKYLKGKRGKKGCVNSVLWFLESNGRKERLVRFIGKGLLLNLRTG
jgi:hypothetical protein